MNVTTTIHPRHASRLARVQREHAVIESRFAPSARELFGPLRDRMLASRPVVGTRIFVPAGARPDKKGVLRTESAPIFGKPTFRNVIVEGVHL